MVIAVIIYSRKHALLQQAVLDEIPQNPNDDLLLCIIFNTALTAKFISDL